MARDTRLLTGTGGTSRFPQTPSPGPLRGQAPAAPARDTGFLKVRAVALAFWLVCVLVVVVPAFTGSSDQSSGGSAQFRQPQPPEPRPGTPVKQ